MKAQVFLFGVMLGGLLVAGQAQAGTKTATIPVTLTVETSCSVVARGALSVAAVGNRTAARSANMGLSVSCTEGAPYRVAVEGAHDDSSGGHFLEFVDVNGDSHKIPYTVYQDAAHQIVWATGDHVMAVPSAAATGDKGDSHAALSTVHGVPVGPYSDTITVTVSF